MLSSEWVEFGRLTHSECPHISMYPCADLIGVVELDVVVCESAPALKLFALKNKTLLIRRDTLRVVYLLLNLLDSVARVRVDSQQLAC